MAKKIRNSGFGVKRHSFIVLIIGLFVLTLGTLDILYPTLSPSPKIREGLHKPPLVARGDVWRGVNSNPPLVPAQTDNIPALLTETPVLPEAISERVYEIYESGQEQGNNVQAFAKAGDSNSNSPRFLNEIDKGNYDLGDYPELQTVIDFFSGSFDRQNQTTNGGFNFYAMQDTLLANPQFCEGGETPLTCELRISQPSVMLIMFGSNDLQDLRPERYETLLRQFLDTLIENGVIPVLYTYTQQDNSRLWDQMITFNEITIQVADEYQIPLINFWRAADDLPDNGVSEDTIHLTFGSQEVRFDGSEAQWGHDLRNLLTLQMLDRLREDVLNMNETNQ